MTTKKAKPATAPDVYCIWCGTPRSAAERSSNPCANCGFRGISTYAPEVKGIDPAKVTKRTSDPKELRRQAGSR